MNKKEFAKALNYLVTDDKFDNRDTNDYIYASLSQPPIKIIDKNNSNEELDYTVECPNCGSYVNYGTQTYMLSGHIYCSNGDCRETLVEKLGDPYRW